MIIILYKSRWWQILRLFPILAILLYAPTTVAKCASDFLSNPSWGRFTHTIKSDFFTIYSPSNLVSFGGALTIAAVSANTSVDQNVNNYFQQYVRNDFTDAIGITYRWTHLEYFAPVMGAGLAVDLWNLWGVDSPIVCSTGIWFEHMVRGFGQTLAPMYALQITLGSTRPKYHEYKGSYWHPFHADHGVSGDAYVGGMMFITAAQVSHSTSLKIFWYTLSFFPAIGRINYQAHYLSQVFLGWTFAYISASAISESSNSLLHSVLNPSSHVQLSAFPLQDGGMVMVHVYY